MNKKTKTALIVALSLFGAGVVICFCISLSVHFDFSRLSDSFRVGVNSEEKIEAEHVDKNIEAKGQDLIFNLSSADIVVTPSDDDMIHISYDNSEDSYFELKEKDGSITLTQKGTRTFFLWSMNFQDTEAKVTVSIPGGHDGTLNINGASSDISVSELDIGGKFGIFGVSGEVNIKDCECKTLETGTTSGEIKLASLKTDSIKASTVSGDIELSDITKSIPVTLASTSGEVYAENVKAKDMGIHTVSGEIRLISVTGQKATISSTSGSAELTRADFEELDFDTVSGDISGTVVGAAEDYKVFTDTVSGSSSLPSNKESGERALDLSSVSGSFEIDFVK